MPKTTTTEHILRDALSQAAGGPVDTIPDGGRLEQDFGVDSLALAELLTDPEGRLSIVIQDEVTGRPHTIADLRALLARLVPSGTDTA